MLIFDTQNNEQLCQLKGHSGRVTRVAFAGQDLVASSSDDGSIRFWDRTTGMEKEGAVPGSVLEWSNCREQQVGRFRVAAEGDLLTICLAAEGGAGKASRATRASRRGQGGAATAAKLRREYEGHRLGLRAALAGCDEISADDRDAISAALADFEAAVEAEIGATGRAQGGGKAEGAPVAFFRAPSPIGALVCTGADIVLGCESGAVLQLQAEVLLT
eukprot:Tamp_17009.p2 GENE.Tamp_17009~~Tamp_17009.p2  ORF type:complete len:217 (+),score=50.23 Tamp_17009:703-1353(+)